MNKRINIILPDETVTVLNRVAAKGARSQFINEAVLHYIEARGKEHLRMLLAAGYRATAAQDLQMAADWFPIEEQAHVLVERPDAPNRRAKRK